MNIDFIRDERFTCKYCNNPNDPILNKKMPYYYKYPSCNHELCFSCIDKSSNNHRIQLKDIDCSICKNDIKNLPDFILNKSQLPDELHNELNTYYNHFSNMNDKFNEYNETARYQNKNLKDFYFDEGSYAQKIMNPLDSLSFRETDKTNEIKTNFKNSIDDSMLKIYAMNYNIIRIMNQYNISLDDLVNALPEDLDNNKEDEN
jgi:hypothetical protein